MASDVIILDDSDEVNNENNIVNNLANPIRFDWDQFFKSNILIRIRKPFFDGFFFVSIRNKNLRCELLPLSLKKASAFCVNVLNK